MEDTDYIILDTTTGDYADGVFETKKEAEEWISKQDIPEKYEIYGRD